MSNKGWKQFERRCARRMGVERIPVTGIDRNGADFSNAMFDVQCKLREGQPAYLREWLSGIVATAKGHDRVGIVVWKETGAGRPDDEAIVLMRWKDFTDLHGDVVESDK
jgi:hypothetical protein